MSFSFSAIFRVPNAWPQDDTGSKKRQEIDRAVPEFWFLAWSDHGFSPGVLKC